MRRGAILLDQKRYDDDENVFDIVAGTSIGAINAAILVSHVKKNGKWEGSPKKLIDFWEYLSSSLTSNFKDRWVQALTAGWRIWYMMFPYLNLGSPEAFRRYYSSKISLSSPYGEPSVFVPLIPLSDTKFLDYLDTSAWWFRYSNEPLRSSIAKFVEEFPVATSYDKNSGKENKYAILYDGIELNHIMASSSVPLHYRYTEIEAINSKGEKETHYFWDGGLLSNTPLRELISEHILFWKNRLKIDPKELSADKWSENQSKWKIPDLEAYVVSVWPSKEDKHSIPLNDYDLTKDRKNDITHHDKTEY